jgi:peptidyl-prolyl cis-trans isomerase D
MLQAMRRFTKSWISSAFLGVLTLSFVVWGVADVFRGSSSTTTLVSVGSTPVDQAAFKRDYDNYLRLEGARLGHAISAQEAQREKLGEKLLQQSIDRTALDNVVSSLHLTASDATVTARIQAVPEFAGLTGTFDRQTFLEVISRMNYSEQGFIEAERSDASREQLLYAVEGGYALPLGYGQALFAYYTEQRAAQYVIVNAKSLTPIAPPADAALEAFVKQNAARYSTPEYRDVTYAELTPQDVMGSMSVSEEQIKTAYDNNKDQYVILEKRHLEQMAFQSEADAKAVRAKIDAGTDFDALATARGLKASDIDIGDLSPADLTDSRSAAFSLPEGGVSQPLKTNFGWVLLHVVKITPGKTTSFEQAHDQLKQALLQQLAEAKLDDVSNAYTDASSGGLSLVKAAAKVGMHVINVPAMDENGLAPDGSKAGVPDDPEFRKLVARADVGEEGDPVLAKSGNLYVILVNGITPPKLKPLAAVRADALASWTAVQRALLLKQRAQELTAQANRDKSLDVVAKTAGSAVQSSPALARNTSDATFSPDLIAALFDAMPGQAVYGPLGKGDGYVVARLTGIAHRLPPPNDLNFIEAMRELSGVAASDITDLFDQTARNRQGVHYSSSYQKLLNDVTGGEGS